MLPLFAAVLTRARRPSRRRDVAFNQKVAKTDSGTVNESLLQMMH